MSELDRGLHDDDELSTRDPRRLTPSARWGAQRMTLVVEFAGVEVVVRDALTFGRAGDLEIDTNPHLHRVVGEFARDTDSWWLINRGTRLFLTVSGADGTHTQLAPGARQSLHVASGVVAIAVGQARYEVGFSFRDRSSEPTPPAGVPSGDTTAYEVVLTPREVDFLVTFASGFFTAASDPFPTYAEVASIWDVSRKTLDNTLQVLRRKLRSAGLIRDEPLEAVVRIAFANSLVTLDDYRWANLDADRPRSSADGPRFALD